jgi:hypothetical protein
MSLDPRTSKLIFASSIAYCAVCINAENTFAATISGQISSSTRSSVIPYENKLGYQKFRITVTAAAPKALSAIGTEKYKDVMQKSYPKWSFSDAQNRYGNQSLKGEFVIAVNDACEAGPNICTVNSLAIIGGPDFSNDPQFKAPTSVGSIFGMTFTPGDSSETFGSTAGQVNYLQIVKTSFSDLLCSPKDSFHVDRPGCSPMDPYYNSVNQSFTYFFDRPITPRYNLPQYFDGEVFLAKPGNSNSVTLYDGVSWGFKTSVVRVTPASSNLLSMLPPSQDPSRYPPPNGRCLGDASCYGNYVAAFTNYDLIIAESNLSLDAAAQTNTDSVPSPALLPGMIATGIYHGRKWRKQKHQNQNSNDLAA